MSVRRCLLSIGLALAATGCAENLSSPSSVETEPHFLRWATPTPPRFHFQGVASAGFPISALVTQAPAVVDQSSSAVGDVQTLTWSHNGGTGTNRLLIVGVSLLTASRPVASVTYQGVPLTFLGARNNDDNSTRVELWYRVAPPTGTGNVVVTRTGSDETIAGAVTLTGVNQTTPLGPFASAASTGSGTTNPSVALTSAVGDLVVDAVVTNGAVVLTPGADQTQHRNRDYDNEMDGAGSTELGAASVTMSWTKTAAAKWAIAAVSVKPAPSVSLTQYQAAFWAKRGQSRSVQINYAAGGGTSPFMKLTITDPTYVPGRGNLAAGDSVLVTATVDPYALAVSLEPHQMQFGTPAQLQIWYGGAGGDLNGDGVVNSSDTYIENQLLGMWYQGDPSSPWSTISATQSLSGKSFTAPLNHFSQYAVAW